VFEAILDEWRAQQTARYLKAKTIQHNEGGVRAFVGHVGRFPSEWRTSDVDEYFEDLLSRPQRLARTTLRAYGRREAARRDASRPRARRARRAGHAPSAGRRRRRACQRACAALRPSRQLLHGSARRRRRHGRRFGPGHGAQPSEPTGCRVEPRVRLRGEVGIGGAQRVEHTTAEAIDRRRIQRVDDPPDRLVGTLRLLLGADRTCSANASNRRLASVSSAWRRHAVPEQFELDRLGVSARGRGCGSWLGRA